MAVVRSSLFSGRAAAQHDDADGSHQQGQAGDDQAPVVFVKQGTAQQGGVREFSVVYLRTDGGAFRIEVGGRLGGEGGENDGRGAVVAKAAGGSSHSGFGGGCVLLPDFQIVPGLFCAGHRTAVRFFGAGQRIDDANKLAEEEAGDDDTDSDGERPAEGGCFLLHIQQHDDEREEHHNGPGVYKDLENAQEVGSQPDHDGGGGSKGKSHHHGGGDGVAHEDDHQGQDHGQGPENVKKYVAGKNVHNVREMECSGVICIGSTC